MNFYELEIEPIRREVENYFNSMDFKLLICKYQNEFFKNNYYDKLVTYCNGGKCIRAFLVNLGYKLATELTNKVDIKAEVAYEIFEAGILAHDDVIDKSSTRRNIPSMFVALGNGHIGISRCICLGDIGLLMSNALLENTSYDANLILKAIHNQNKIFLYTLSGELQDIDLSKSVDYTEHEVIEMYKAKLLGIR